MQVDAPVRGLPRFFVIANADPRDFLPRKRLLQALFASAITAIAPGA